MDDQTRSFNLRLMGISEGENGGKGSILRENSYEFFRTKKSHETSV